MSFQESAFSLRSRLHIGEVKPAVLIGALVVVAIVVTCAVFGIVSATTTHGFEVRQAHEQADQNTEGDSSQDGSTTDSDDAALAASEASLVCVHVSGCVANPGIYYLSEGSRVADAIQAAGGCTDDAAPGSINQARVVNDGEQIAVPSAEEAAGAAAGAQGVVSTGAGDMSGAGGLVNINTADATLLQTLDGIGEATAAKIIKDREANGPYRTIEDIKRVSGIGDKKFENIKDSICVG